MDTRVALLLALSVCAALAQDMGHSMNQRCSCRRVRDRFGPARLIMDIQILPPSHSCNRVEIVVSLKNGLQFCMDPNDTNVQKIIRSIIDMKKKNMTPNPKTTTSTNSTSTIDQ